MRLFYAAEALEDLVRLRQFMAEHNPAADQRIGADLVQRLQHIADFPAIGRPVEQAPDPESIGDVIFGNYIVRYSMHQQSVIILRIWHHRAERE